MSGGMHPWFAPGFWFWSPDDKNRDKERECRKL